MISSLLYCKGVLSSCSSHYFNTQVLAVLSYGVTAIKSRVYTVSRILIHLICIQYEPLRYIFINILIASVSQVVQH